MKRKLGGLLAALLLVAILPTGSVAAAGSGYVEILREPPTDPEITLIEGAQLEQRLSLDMWHHSGGYWRVGNKGADKIQISDEEIKRQKAKDISQILSTERAEFTVSLPRAVRERIAAGRRIVVEIRSGEGAAELSQLFVENADSVDEDMQYRIEGDTLYFSAKPKFNVIASQGLFKLTFWTFGLNTRKVIPFIAPEYGYNLYSVFGNGYEAKQANGWINPKAPGSLEGMPKGRIHPSMIADTSGRLKGGYPLQLGMEMKEDSAGFQIGQGTFSNAGACGLHFDYPVQFVFYETEPLPVCTVCGGCELSKGEACSPETCKSYGTYGCDCYQPEQATAPPDTPADGGCAKTIQWSERQAHRYSCGGCQEDGSCPGHSCSHVYTYQSTLQTSVTVAPSTLKSGYGFAVTANNTVKTEQISNVGICGTKKTKANSKTPAPPKTVEVRTNWKVINKEKKTTQNSTVALALQSSSATTSNFACAANPVSNYKNKLIYTDVALKGTAAKPVRHTIHVYVYGGGVNQVAFCSTEERTITINGNMYEDDWTVDGGR